MAGSDADTGISDDLSTQLKHEEAYQCKYNCIRIVLEFLGYSFSIYQKFTENN